ncbi:RNA-guided endonuclease InsQ/TnpB family protein [Polynucleobacter rarus]|uniref:RNA-guided endonuclease InsQ/TnpB family protein n=1 Tax=Polynucleobacter rarus TaxID=556055 RepID=UPI000D3E7954|nr:RNA-guided endonuclease TnpB family protein [Polynucleobacter rarus]
MKKTQQTNIRVLRERVKDKHCTLLNNLSKEVNLVWNYCNELSSKHTDRTGQFMSSYTMDKYTAGATKEGLNIPASTVQAISSEYCARRKQFKKRRLAWRKSGGSKRSLGWIPFKKDSIHYRNGQIFFQKKPISIFKSYDLQDKVMKSGSFSQDARGRWYVNLTVEVQICTNNSSPRAVGIDLGLKTTAVTSDGIQMVSQRYRELEKKLAVAQRANKNKLAKTISAKIKNRRSNDQHQFSRLLANKYGAIFVGNISSSKLIKTKMAKSVYDAGWSQFKTMLEYKCHEAGVVFLEVNESNTTQTCSSCGEKPPSRPKGIAGLGIRQWTCDCCGVIHDRDINASKNILRIGLDTLVVGASKLKQEGFKEPPCFSYGE